MLPNPFEWALGTQAYLQLMREWPEYAAAMSPTGVETMERLGLAIQDAIRKGPTTGANATTPSPLFDALFAKYRMSI